MDEKISEVKQEVKQEEGEETNKPKEKESKTFTQEDVNKIIAKEKAKLEKRFQHDLAEKEKVAQMDEKEKAKYTQDKQAYALAEKEKELAKRELAVEAKTLLADKGLPTELYRILAYENEEALKESIETVETTIQKAVEQAVAERLKGSAPRKAPATQATSLQEEIRKAMGLQK